MSGPFRCSGASRELREPVEGTASTVRSFLLVEFAGPWGVEALRDSRLDDEVKSLLRHVEASRAVRPLLMRRDARSVGKAVRVFTASTVGERPWVETALLGDVRELLDLDLSPLGDGRSLALEPHPEPVLLVCTHGRHDACCAERGRPLYAALRAAAPSLTWQVSHIGGDRFAPNVLVLPHGLYYGGLGAEDAQGLVETHLSGRLDLDHLRGRTAYAFPVQAAEVYLRRRLGFLDIEPLRVERRQRIGPETRVVLVAQGRSWEVRVRSAPGEPRRLTCSSQGPAPPLVHELVGIREAGASS